MRDKFKESSIYSHCYSDVKINQKLRTIIKLLISLSLKIRTWLKTNKVFGNDWLGCETKKCLTKIIKVNHNFYNNLSILAKTYSNFKRVDAHNYN